MRRKLMWGVLGVVMAGAVATVVVWRMAFPPSEAASARADLLAAPQNVRLQLSIDIPKGSEPENPDHQVIDATGVVDLAAGTGELNYDFNELNNAAGFLGHLEVMDVVFGDGAIYFDIFIDGPPWVRVDPDDVGTGDVARLQDILFTNPLTLAPYLELDATELEGDTTTGQLGPDELASGDDAFASAVGAALGEWGVEVIEFAWSENDAGPLEMVLSFAYRPDGVGRSIKVKATYELEPADAPPDIELPVEDDTREYSDIFGAT